MTKQCAAAVHVREIRRLSWTQPFIGQRRARAILRSVDAWRFEPELPVGALRPTFATYVKARPHPACCSVEPRS